MASRGASPPTAEGVGGGVPGHVPAHEVVIADALVLGSLAEDRVGDATGVQVGRLAGLGGVEGATFALLVVPIVSAR